MQRDSKCFFCGQTAKKEAAVIRQIERILGRQCNKTPDGKYSVPPDWTGSMRR